MMTQRIRDRLISICQRGYSACRSVSGLRRIFDGDTRFYDLLENGGATAKQSASLLAALLPQLIADASTEALAELLQARRKHKRISRQTTEELCRNFVTPLEREDIEALSKALYKISKNAEKIGERLVIAPTGTALTPVTRQIALLETATDVVVKMVSHLRKKSHVEDIRDDYELLQTVEGEADKLMNELLRELYHGTEEAQAVVFWKEVFELLEKGIDRCRDAGYVLFHITLKYS